MTIQHVHSITAESMQLATAALVAVTWAFVAIFWGGVQYGIWIGKRLQINRTPEDMT